MSLRIFSWLLLTADDVSPPEDSTLDQDKKLKIGRFSAVADNKRAK